MTGATIKERLERLGISHKEIAEHLGMSPQNFYKTAINNDNVKSDLLERISAAADVSVSYFYNELPIISLDEYDRVVRIELENVHLRELLEEKERTIQILTQQKR